LSKNTIINVIRKIFIKKLFNNLLSVGKIGSLAFAEGSALCVGAKDNVPMWAGNKIVTHPKKSLQINT